MQPLDISEVARRTGLPASTLRFYEQQGLIASTGRHGLKRVFAPGVLERLSLIALGRATAAVEHSDDLSAEVILAQVRSIVADMLALCGMDPLEATDVIPLR